jgi:SAM-dependent methyltransferase
MSEQIEAHGPNAAQIEFWNGEAAEAWVRHEADLDRLLATLSERALERAAVRPGERVLDVGCGAGATTLALAARGARVTGIDISGPMLARARTRAEAVGADAAFVLADATQHRFDPEHDLLFSRFGVMFFADPIAAFRNLRGGLRDTGRACFLCWRALRENPWIGAPLGAVLAHLPSQPPADPRAPGGFAFADPAYVQEILTEAGFRDIGIEPLETELTLGADLDSAYTLFSRISPLRALLASADAATRAAAESAARAALAAHAGKAGVKLGAACWVVSAAY